MKNHAAVVFPSCNPVRAKATSKKWLEQGYDVYLYLEVGMPKVKGAHCFWGNYPGCNATYNILADFALKDKKDAIIMAADDMDPDPLKIGNTIVEECYKDYGSLWVMQPAGDHFQKDNICGSPWLSVEWCLRAYKGRFPYAGWYWQYFGDDELFIVANRLGVHHRRVDLTQYHHHWWRPNSTVEITDYQKHHQENWYPKDEIIFNARKEANFPGSGLL